MSFNLEIISPQKVIFNDEIDLCILPGVEGDFGILKNHMPFLTTLRLGLHIFIKIKNLLKHFSLMVGWWKFMRINVHFSQKTSLNQRILKRKMIILSLKKKR